MNTTNIEWCDVTINPIVGCSRISSGCANCYAERIATMRVKHPNPKISGKYAGTVDDAGKWTGVINFDVSCLLSLPKTPKRIFVGSMCDTFHDAVSDSMLAKIFAFAAVCSCHTFLYLTKRPERMRAFMLDISTTANDRRGAAYQEIARIYGLDPNMDGLRWPLSNVWLGVTVCNRDELYKLDILREIPAAKRFVSFEPLLSDLNSVNLAGIDWIICGGETGPGARPMHPDWVRSLRDQCKEAGVPFFFKGWGNFSPDYDGSRHYTNCYARVPMEEPVPMYRVGKKRSGRFLDDEEWNEVPA